jgi:hypothetical protein
MTVDPVKGGKRRRLLFVTVTWGDWHRGMFLDANLPTMLAPGNLPDLISGVDCEYLIYTTPKDAVKIARNRAFQRLHSLLPVSLKLFTPSKTKNIFALHHGIWAAATKHARRRGAFILLMPPDVAWADGSFAHLRAALDAGKRAIFMTYPRVVSETFVPAMAEHFPCNANHAITVPPLEMTRLAITHIHPLMAAYDRSASHFPIHPEMVLWPVDGDGFLLRLLARELFCFEPGRYPLNEQSLLARMPAEEEIHVFRDSRQFLGVSFTPLWKDMEWYLKATRLDPLFVGRWWLKYDSPFNNYISAVNLRFTSGGGTAAAWRRAELQADNLIANIGAAREFTRVLLTLQKMKHARAAAFLAAALRVHGLARRWSRPGPFVILAPTDEAFERAAFHRIPGDGMSTAQLRRLIEPHLAPLRKVGTIEEGETVRTLDGRVLRLEKIEGAQHCGQNILLPVDEIYARPLPRDSGSAQTPEPVAVRTK